MPGTVLRCLLIARTLTPPHEGEVEGGVGKAPGGWFVCVWGGGAEGGRKKGLRVGSEEGFEEEGVERV